MQQNLNQYRSPEERSAWNSVLERIPRGRNTRGLHFEVLEYLFEHLDERISETEIRDHLLEIRGKLQPTGDPVKVAINLAIKELQRLPSRSFEIVKMQVPNPKGKQIRYVQMKFPAFRGLLRAGAFAVFMRSLLFERRQLTLRLVCQHGHETLKEPFPGIQAEWLSNHHVTFLSNRETLPGIHADNMLVIPTNPAVDHTVLVYNNDQAHLPALAIHSDLGITTQAAEAQFYMYRSNRHEAMVKLFHERWHALYRMALPVVESKRLRQQAHRITSALAETDMDMTEEAAYQGLLADMVSKQRGAQADLGS